MTHSIIVSPVRRPVVVSEDDDLAVVTTERTAVIVDPGPSVVVSRASGPQGPVGASGTGVFISQAQPAVAGSYLWVELNPDGSPRTFWVNS